MDLVRYHKYASFLLGILFLVTLQQFAKPIPVFRYMAPAFVLFLTLATTYNYWYLKVLEKLNIWVLLRPILLFSSAFGLFLLLPNNFLRGWYLLFMVVLVTFFEIFLGNFAENVLLNETLIICFGFFVSLAAWSQYFPEVHIFYLALIFLATFLPTRAFYEFFPHSVSHKNIMSTAIALFCTEIFWALSFLPFHYSAIALLLFNAYYFFVILTYYSAYNTLTVKKLQFNLVLLVVVAAWILLLTPWKPLN